MIDLKFKAKEEILEEELKEIGISKDELTREEFKYLSLKRNPKTFYDQLSIVMEKRRSKESKKLKRSRSIYHELAWDLEIQWKKALNGWRTPEEEFHSVFDKEGRLINEEPTFSLNKVNPPSPNVEIKENAKTKVEDLDQEQLEILDFMIAESVRIY